mmetsp:Transcript_28847/g.53059  ORF Transcript_28847/g.53059 Transcript_28847/m.53059 type:complete len:270 (+) Transcript_28847:30-839(+)
MSHLRRPKRAPGCTMPVVRLLSSSHSISALSCDTLKICCFGRWRFNRSCLSCCFWHFRPGQSPLFEVSIVLHHRCDLRNGCFCLVEAICCFLELWKETRGGFLLGLQVLGSILLSSTSIDMSFVALVCFLLGFFQICLLCFQASLALLLPREEFFNLGGCIRNLFGEGIFHLRENYCLKFASCFWCLLHHRARTVNHHHVKTISLANILQRLRACLMCDDQQNEFVLHHLFQGCFLLLQLHNVNICRLSLLPGISQGNLQLLCFVCVGC